MNVYDSDTDEYFLLGPASLSSLKYAAYITIKVILGAVFVSIICSYTV